MVKLKDNKNSFKWEFVNLFLILAIVIFLGFLTYRVNRLEKILSQNTNQNDKQPAPATVTIDQVKKLFSKDFIHFGEANNKLLIVEVSDPSCPFCHIAGGQNPEIATQAGDRFKYQSQGGSYIPPLTEIKKLVDQGKASFAFLYSNGHGNGQLAAQALYCANEKGVFWPVHDKLMTNEGYNLINETVRNDKSKIGDLVAFLSNEIDSQFLKGCLESGKYEKFLARDEQLSPSLGFQGTPHFLINNKMFPGAYSFTDMKSEVDQALK